MTRPRPTSTTLSWALRLTSQGLPCFPCGFHKRPLTPQGFKDASRDREVVRALWVSYPGPLIGVPTGEASGLHVLDVDARHRGNEWFARRRNDIPITRVHRTRSGGLHLFFRHEPGIRCSAGRLAPGVDVRASGGYVIWWPAAGLPALSDSPAAEWPQWLRTALLHNQTSRTSRAVVPDNASLLGLLRAVATAKPGERNALAFWGACRAGEMVASGLMNADSAAALIAEAAMRSGLPAAEAQRTAWSGIRTTGGRS
jgi:Bifunctional DNA primase/polymerase, N-terminal